MYYAEIDTVSDKLSAMVIGATIIDTIKGVIQWRKNYKWDYKDIKEVEIRENGTDLFILRLKFIMPNAVEFDY